MQLRGAAPGKMAPSIATRLSVSLLTAESPMSEVGNLLSAPSGEMSPNSVDEDDSKQRGPGYRLLVYVTNTPASRNAVQFTANVLAEKCSEVTLAYCSQNPFYHEGMERTLEVLAESLQGFVVRTTIFEKREDQSLVEAMEEYASAMNPDICVISSSTLCNEDASLSGRTSWSGSSAPFVKPTRQAFALKLCQAIRSTPILVVKANSKGGTLSHNHHHSPIKYMVDLQPTCRHMLNWLMKLMKPSRDHMFFAVPKAYDVNGVMTPTAVRMFTAFSVQCSVNHIKPERRLLKGPAEKALSQAALEDEVDLLMIQAPRTKDLSPYITSILCSAATSILVFPPAFESTALGQKPLPTEEVRLPRIPSATATHPESRNSSQVSVSYDGSTATQLPEPPPAVVAPTRRAQAYSASGYGYSYSTAAKPPGKQVDSVCAAAMEALVNRASRRKAIEDRQKKLMTQVQRGRSGSVTLGSATVTEVGPPQPINVRAAPRWTLT